jgi:hypothetical protein
VAPVPDGGLQQTFESSADGGKTWTISFDGFYQEAKSLSTPLVIRGKDKIDFDASRSIRAHDWMATDANRSNRCTY